MMLAAPVTVVNAASRRCYRRGCHHHGCRQANATYEARRRAHAVPAFVGADRVRQHLDWLAQQGVGAKPVAAHAGVHYDTVRRIRSGCRHRLRPATEHALLSVLPDAAADHALVDAGRTWAAIGLLVGAGWSRAQIARRVHGPNVCRLRVGRVRVTRRTERVVLEVAATVARRVEIPVRASSAAAVDVSDWFEADESWRRRRACRGRDPRVFMPGRGDQDAIVKAKRLCGRCPVRESCLAFALARPAVVGVWGASTEHERAVIRRESTTGRVVKRDRGSGQRRAREWLDRCRGGETCAAIAHEYGCSRTNVGSLIRYYLRDEWLAFQANKQAARRALRDVERERRRRERLDRLGPCVVCGKSIQTLGRSARCSSVCQVAWYALRLHLPEWRDKHRVQATTWAHENGTTSDRHYERVKNGTAREHGRWLVIGSTTWHVAIEACEKGWPIFDRLPEQIQQQVRAALTERAS